MNSFGHRSRCFPCVCVCVCSGLRVYSWSCNFLGSNELNLMEGRLQSGSHPIVNFFFNSQDCRSWMSFNEMRFPVRVWPGPVWKHVKPSVRLPKMKTKIVLTSFSVSFWRWHILPCSSFCLKKSVSLFSVLGWFFASCCLQLLFLLAYCSCALCALLDVHHSVFCWLRGVLRVVVCSCLPEGCQVLVVWVFSVLCLGAE